MHKLIIVTAERETLNWPNLHQYLSDIKKVLDTVKNSTFSVGIRDAQVTPEIVDGRITHKWFDTFSAPYYAQGYDFVHLHFSNKQKKAWGILPKLGGSSHTNDGDLVGEAWFWSDRLSVRKGQKRFVEVCLHEMSHLLAKGTKVPDFTHKEDTAKKTVVALFKTYNMNNYLKVEKEIEEKKTLLASLLAKLQAMLPREKLLPRVERQAQELLRSMDLLGMPMRITEGYRTNARQNELYAQGRTKAGAIVTNAKGGESFHNYGVAVDFVFRAGYNVPESHWKTFGTVAVSKGFEWGGNWTGFGDRPHVQMPLGYTLADFKNGKVDYNKYK